MIMHKYIGHGLVNKLINILSVELHVPGGYQYCGPGIELAKRLARGDDGINPLDAACKEHNISYSKNQVDIKARSVADKILAEKAWKRVLAKDASFGERAAAYAAANVTKLKTKFGMGLKRKLNERKTKNPKNKKKVKKKTTIRFFRKSWRWEKCKNPKNIRKFLLKQGELFHFTFLSLQA